jgi:hypothetical protein
MTLPDERYRAVMWANKFLTELASDRKKYPRIPKEVRSQAWSILRHYPSSWDMERAAKAAPDVFQERLEPVTRLFMQYEESKNEKE